MGFRLIALSDFNVWICDKKKVITDAFEVKGEGRGMYDSNTLSCIRANMNLQELVLLAKMI